MTNHVESQIPHRTKIGMLPLLGGILALSAEATVMAALMAMAGICALVLLIGGLKGSLRRRNPAAVARSGRGWQAPA
jgi:hypothetical protein